jgi:hypothetical protein
MKLESSPRTWTLKPRRYTQVWPSTKVPVRHTMHRHLVRMVGGRGSGPRNASDASFADQEVARKSSQGHILMLFGGVVLWKAARQAAVTTSTTDVKVLALG